MTKPIVICGDVGDQATWGLIEDGSVDLIVTSPPYKKKDGWTPQLMKDIGAMAGLKLREGGRVFLNFGQLREDPARPWESTREVMNHGGLDLSQTIAWVKSLAIDGKQRGHYQPLNSERVLNYCWEPIFILYKGSEERMDRLSVGVPFADKGNLKRGTRGKAGDLHCAGDVWFLPHKTTGRTRKKAHAHQYPAELVRRCVLLSNLKPGSRVLDPFMGSGTTVAVASRLGHVGIGVDRDPERCAAFSWPDGVSRLTAGPGGGTKVRAVKLRKGGSWVVE